MTFSPLPVRVQKSILRAMFRNYERAKSHPRIARFIFCYRTFFDEKFRLVVAEILSAQGDVAKAAYELKGKMPADSVTKLCKWADAVKGGAL